MCGSVRIGVVRFAKARNGVVGSAKVRFPMTKTEKNRLTEIAGVSNGEESFVEMQKPYRVEVEIEGACPILFHRWNNESVAAKARAKKGSQEKKTDDIESFVYRNEKGVLCIPGEYLRQAVIHAAKYEQDPRSPRKSMMDLMKAALVSLTELASLGVKDWEYVDQRRVVIQRSAVTRSRPAMKMGWKAKFVLMCNLPEYLSPQKLNQMIAQGGRIGGLGDFRPSYGRYNVTRFEVLSD